MKYFSGEENIGKWLGIRMAVSSGYKWPRLSYMLSMLQSGSRLGMQCVYGMLHLQADIVVLPYILDPLIRSRTPYWALLWLEWRIPTTYHPSKPTMCLASSSTTTNGSTATLSFSSSAVPPGSWNGPNSLTYPYIFKFCKWWKLLEGFDVKRRANGVLLLYIWACFLVVESRTSWLNFACFLYHLLAKNNIHPYCISHTSSTHPYKVRRKPLASLNPHCHPPNSWREKPNSWIPSLRSRLRRCWARRNRSTSWAKRVF